MFAKLFIMSFLAIVLHCRYVQTRSLFNDGHFIQNWDKRILKKFKSIHPEYYPSLSRERRETHGEMNNNPDGSLNVMGKLPFAENEDSQLSIIGGVKGAKTDNGYESAFGGISWDHINGHGLSVTGSHIPDFGKQLSGAGKVNLYHNDFHDLVARAHAAKTIPLNPLSQNFNTYGGGIDYTFYDKVGASFDFAYTDLFKKLDYTAMAKLNLFKNPSSSLDLSVGATKSLSPFDFDRTWKPSAGITYTKHW